MIVYIFFVVVFFLWMTTAVLLLTNHQNNVTRWGGFIAFFGGCGGFGVLLGDGPKRPDWILWADSLATSLSHNMTPYVIFIFGLVFAEVFKTRRQMTIWKTILLLPVLYMYTIDELYPVFHSTYSVLVLWTTPYVIGCDILLIYSTLKESRPSIKRNKIYTCMVIMPIVTFALISNIILEALGIPDVWFYNPAIVTLGFVIFAYLIIRYGFLDVKIRFERQRIDHTMKALTSGPAMFNHTIKNEIAKIDMLVNEIKNTIPHNETASEYIDLALKSTNHVRELSSRIQSKLDVIYLKESDFWLSECISSSIELLQPYLEEKVKVEKIYHVDARISGDFVHLQETFLNIIKNAVEAMNGQGEILIKIYKIRRKVYIHIEDNGAGIEKDKIFLVLNPFYSTKGSRGNYGLGLSYCYNVMQKHSGDICIKSKLGEGTTISLSIPGKRVKETNENIKKVTVGDHNNDCDKSNDC
ncbi:sensor histidine kinase [Bacillus mycoides]|uniref:sensor histidine kinase n=1 Tax=Bacillus mycoides TaxID=1405 RepID=UPI0010BEBC5D|nr:sensor histidine kinase [Bacillus mycoides]TKI39973.1 GHKL domain-containing protein [Bacillus mycoides]